MHERHGQLLPMYAYRHQMHRSIVCEALSSVQLTITVGVLVESPPYYHWNDVWISTSAAVRANRGVAPIPADAVPRLVDPHIPDVRVQVSASDIEEHPHMSG